MWDVWFKSNTRNLRLLEAHIHDPVRAKRSDLCFMLLVFLLVFVAPLLFVALVIVAIVLGVLAATGHL